MHEITPDADIINAGSIPERITDLESKRDRNEWDDDELTALRELYRELEGMLGTAHLTGDNPVIVRETYWKDYARQTAYDIGDVSEDGSVDAFVDWDGYADSMRQDWAPVEFAGITYLVRG